MIKEPGEGGEGRSPPETETIRLTVEGCRHRGVTKMNRLHLQTWIRKKNCGDYPKLRRLTLKDRQAFRSTLKLQWRNVTEVTFEGWRQKGRSVTPLIDASRLTINMKGQSGHSSHPKVLSKNLFQHRMWCYGLKEEICYSVICRISPLPARLWCVVNVTWLMQFGAQGLDFRPSSDCWHKEHRRLRVKTGFTKTRILKIHLRLTAIVSTDTLKKLILRKGKSAIGFLTDIKNRPYSWNCSGSLWRCQRW